MKKNAANWALWAIIAVLLSCSGSDNGGVGWRSGSLNDRSCPGAPDAAVGATIPICDIPGGACGTPESLACHYVTPFGCDPTRRPLIDWSCTCDSGSWRCTPSTELPLSACFCPPRG
jgi:hypothetical protein